MSFINYFDTTENISAHDEQRIFLETLHHDIRGGHTVTLSIDDSGVINSAPNYLGQTKLVTNSSKNYYTSVNSFKGYSRKTNKIFNLTAIVLDLDMHDCALNAKELESELNDLWNNKDILPPTMITFSGRGFHLYYVLKHSVPATSDKAIALFTKTADALFDKYAANISHAKVDYSVKDFARVLRLPGTVNQANGEIARLVGLLKESDGSPSYYDLPEIISGCQLVFEQKVLAPNLPASKSQVPKGSNDQKILTRRLLQLNKLLSLRDHDITGIRDLFFLCYFAAAKQLLGHDAALNEIKTINNSLKNPLSDKKLINVITPKSTYRFTDEWICSNLCLSNQEKSALKINLTKDGLTKKDIRKAQVKAKREERNALILTLAKDGFYYETIAKKANCSLRTVKYVLKEAGFTRHCSCPTPVNTTSSTMPFCTCNFSSKSNLNVLISMSKNITTNEQGFVKKSESAKNGAVCYVVNISETDLSAPYLKPVCLGVRVLSNALDLGSINLGSNKLRLKTSALKKLDVNTS